MDKISMIRLGMCHEMTRMKIILLFVLTLLVHPILVPGMVKQPEGLPAMLRFGLATAPANLDPRFATDATSARINRLLYAQLVDFDSTFRPVPVLASWQSITPTHYRFHLGTRYRTFHDGTRLSSRDVQATYDFILDPRNASPHRTSLAIIDHITTPDDETVDFFLRRADILFPSYLVIGILPARLVGQPHSFPPHPIGSGHFAFQARPDDTRLRLRRQVDGLIVEFVHVPDPTVRVLKLLAGEIHMLQNDLPPELVQYLADQDDLVIQRGLGSNFVYLGFNHQAAPTKELFIRQAIAHAIDRPSIIHFVLGDAARPASSLLLPSHWAGDPDLPVYAYDPQKARTLLARAGISRTQPLRMVYKTSSDPFRIRLATIVQDQLAHVGIEMTIQSYDWGTFYGDIKGGRFEMYSLSWVGIHSPDIFSYVFHSRAVPPHGANRGRFIDARADQFIETAETAQTMKAKQVAYRQLQEYLARKLPYVPLWFEDHVFIANRQVKGYRLAIDGNYDSLTHVYWDSAS